MAGLGALMTGLGALMTGLGRGTKAWHLCTAMSVQPPESRVHRHLVDSLYVEAMLLADEARGYFDEAGRAEREALEPLLRVGFSCESLKVTTRLMHVIAWLLTQRAIVAGELRARDALDPSRRLGEAPATDTEMAASLPSRARAMIAASEDLHRRVALLDAAQDGDAAPSPARSMQQRLARALS